MNKVIVIGCPGAGKSTFFGNGSHLRGLEFLFLLQWKRKRF